MRATVLLSLLAVSGCTILFGDRRYDHDTDGGVDIQGDDGGAPVDLAYAGDAVDSGDGGDGGRTGGGDGGTPGSGDGGSQGSDDAGPDSQCPGVALATDPRHCGRCDHDCTALPGVDPTAIRCVAGLCTPAGACLSPRAHCTANPDDGCETDLSLSASCGACGNACSIQAPLCTQSGGTYQCLGACTGSTPTECGSTCVNTQTDPNHCGSCAACPTITHGQASCAGGICGAPTCLSGFHLCSSACLSDVSPDSCGASCSPCVPPTNATASCTSSVCDFVCNSGTHRCGGACSSNTDPASCGGSCNPCVPPSNATATCNGAKCDFACNSGFIRSGQQCVPALAWTPQTSNTGSNLLAVWGSGSHDIYVAGTNGVILHSTGNGSWTKQVNSGSDVSALWGSSSSDVYAAGIGGILHSNGGGSWDSGTSFGGIYTIWGSGSSDVYAGGSGGGIVHNAGDGKWTLQDTSTSQVLRGAWGTGSTNIYFVGEVGTVLSSAGDTNWSAMSSNTSLDLLTIWGSGATNIYIGGGAGIILHSTDGGSWYKSRNGDNPFVSVTSIWGSSSSDVYAVVHGMASASSALLHSTGDDTWSSQPSSLGLRAIWGSSASDIYIVGDNGTILHGPP